MLRLVVLGSAAGGGFPQWNCNCTPCRRARAGDPAAPARTQSSIAVSADGKRWLLINASPDLGTQLARTPALHPNPAGAGEYRHNPIAATLVTNADVDHVAGLLTLRESHPFALYGTQRVLGILGANSIFNVLNPDYVVRRPLALDGPQEITDPAGAPLGLTVEAFPVPGKIALWLEDPSLPGFGSQPEDTLGLRIRATGDDRPGNEGALYYIPGCAAMPPELTDRLRGASVVLFDGTTFTEEEMASSAVGVKTASRMGHMCMDGPAGTVAAFAGLNVGRRVFIHINNTNPVLCADTPERRAVEAAGWDVAFDGMEIEL